MRNAVIPDSSSTPQLGRFFLGFAAYLVTLVLVVGSLSPVVYSLFATETTKFRWVFDQVFFPTAFLLLFPLAFFWKISSFAQIGVQQFRVIPGDLLRGFLMASVSASILIGIYFALGARVWHGEGLSPLQVLIDYLLTLFLGFHEELLFRGFFFLGVLALWGRFWKPWLVVHAALFAIGHYLKAKDLPGPVTWSSGFETWGTIFGGVNWGECFNTFLLGLLLCVLVYKQNRIWMAMALHGGWVFMIRILHRYTEATPEASLAWFGDNLRSGLAVSFLLAGFLVWAIFWKKSERSRQQANL